MDSCSIFKIFLRKNYGISLFVLSLLLLFHIKSTKLQSMISLKYTQIMSNNMVSYYQSSSSSSSILSTTELSIEPTIQPSLQSSLYPSSSSLQNTTQPSLEPTVKPSITFSLEPSTLIPSTLQPTTSFPSYQPSVEPSIESTMQLTSSQESSTSQPTTNQSFYQSLTSQPSIEQSFDSTIQPSVKSSTNSNMNNNSSGSDNSILSKLTKYIKLLNNTERAGLIIGLMFFLLLFISMIFYCTDMRWDSLIPDCYYDYQCSCRLGCSFLYKISCCQINSRNYKIVPINNTDSTHV